MRQWSLKLRRFLRQWPLMSHESKQERLILPNRIGSTMFSLSQHFSDAEQLFTRNETSIAVWFHCVVSWANKHFSIIEFEWLNVLIVSLTHWQRNQPDYPLYMRIWESLVVRQKIFLVFIDSSTTLTLTLPFFLGKSLRRPDVSPPNPNPNLTLFLKQKSETSRRLASQP